MSNEHNPIAQRISVMQRKWADAVAENPDKKVVRCQLKFEEARVFEGFLKLESTPHGSLDEIFVVMFTHFEHPDTYGRNFTREWIAAFEKDPTVTAGWEWDYAALKAKVEDESADSDEIFMELATSFSAMLEEKGRELVMGLVPIEIHGARFYAEWLEKIVKKKFPPNVRMLVVDYFEEDYLERFNLRYADRVLHLPVHLDVAGAMDKLVRQGDPNKPEVQFRVCLHEMGKANGKNDLDGVTQWGEKLLEVGQRSGNRNLFAQAHLLFAGMLFKFKEYDRIEELLKQGLRICKHGLQAEDTSFVPINIQTHGLLAAVFHHTKRYPEAIEFYRKQAKLCTENNMKLQGISAHRQACDLAEKKDKDNHESYLKEAHELGKDLTPEELGVSDYIFVEKAYYDIIKYNKLMKAECDDIDERMRAVFGDRWKEDVEKRKEDYLKKIKTDLQTA